MHAGSVVHLAVSKYNCCTVYFPQQWLAVIRPYHLAVVLTLLSVVSSSLALLDVSVYWQDIIRGSILLSAVTIDHYLNKRRG